jgi:osmotically-inducible protein OsmY
MPFPAITVSVKTCHRPKPLSVRCAGFIQRYLLRVAALAIAVSLVTMTGCTSIMASATGDQPVGSDPGERTLSMRLQDSSIKNAADINIYKADKKFHDANVNVISFYGDVLLAGQVQDEDMKAQAEKIVRHIAEVKKIYNELAVEPVSPYLVRSNDSLIDMRIRSNLLLEKGFPSSQTKVFTVEGTVYLMGKLTPADSDRAVNIIKQTSGVKKIIKLMDYLPVPPAAASTPAASAN